MAFHTGPTPNAPGRWVITKFGPPSVLQWQNLDSNIESIAPPPDHALIRIIAAGIGGPDNIQRAGGYPHPVTSQPGFTPGYDMVGEILAVNPSSDTTNTTTTTFQPGNLVASMCMFGAHATHTTLPLSSLLKLPNSLTPSEITKIAALPLNYMTAMGMLRHVPNQPPLAPGSTILIGSVAGGIGTALAQIVHAFNMDLKMYGTCSAHKADYVRDTLGVVPIDRRVHAEDFGAVVKELTGGRGVDLAYDAVGSMTSLRESARATVTRPESADGFDVVGVGVMDDIKQDGSGMNLPDPLAVYTRRLQDVGVAESKKLTFFFIPTDYTERLPEAFQSDFDALVHKVLEGTLNPVVSELLPLRDAVRAHEILIDGSGVMGKMVFVVDSKVAGELGIK